MGGEHDLRTGFAKLLKLANKQIQFHGTLKRYLHQHGILPCHTITFQHIWHIRRKLIEFWLIIRVHIQIDKSQDVISQTDGIDQCVISGNDPIFFHLLNSG